MDLCGFPKDNYYYYKSWWSDQTVLHLFPHWNWPGSEGKPIDVRVFSNCDEVELLLNQCSLGRKSVERNSHVAWSVNYEPGAIEAVGFRARKKIALAIRQTTGVPTRIMLNCDRAALSADGKDVAVVSVSVNDARGRAVPIADNLIQFECSGDGKLLGVGNGDPSSHESDKAPQRRLFNGLCMALVQASEKSGEIRITARSEGLTSASIALKTKRSKRRPSV